MAALSLALGAAPACGNSDQGGDAAGRGGGNARGGSGATVGFGTGGNGGSIVGVGGAGGAAGTAFGSGGTAGTASSGDACSGLPLEDSDAGAGIVACRGLAYEAESVPVDLFVMMDRSISLSETDAASGRTRWEALREAIATFVDEGANQNLRVGMGFFGRTGGNDDALDCDAGYYAEPGVEIGPLSQVGAAITDAMTRVSPGGFTPTAPALLGALEHAAEWATHNPGRATAVVLVTDGYPTQCEPRSVSAIAELAEAAHVTEPYVRTYVIGLAAEFNLDGIARAGGTQKAYRVDAGDSTSSFLQALRSVSNTKLSCRYEIPSPPGTTMVIDHDEVQVTYTNVEGSVEEVPKISDLEACSRNPNGGW